MFSKNMIFCFNGVNLITLEVSKICTTETQNCSHPIFEKRKDFDNFFCFSKSFTLLQMFLITISELIFARNFVKGSFTLIFFTYHFAEKILYSVWACYVSIIFIFSWTACTIFKLHTSLK